MQGNSTPIPEKPKVNGTTIEQSLIDNQTEIKQENGVFFYKLKGSLEWIEIINQTPQ